MNKNIELATKKWLSFDAELASNYPDGINQIYQDKIDGMLLKEVFSKAEMLEVKSRLERESDELETVRYGTTLGCVLMAAGSDKERYFQSANRFREKLKTLFNTNFEARVEAVLNKMSRGRKVEVARENDERIYTPATVRFVYPNRGGMVPHKNNDFLPNSYYDHLKQIAKMVDALSYFIIIDKPESGGDLVLYDLPTEESMTLTKDLDLEKCPKIYITPDIGDMIIFHGGNIVHQITDVTGQKVRITIGGFLAMSKDEQKFLYWS
jgi:hypothetical protein